MSHRLSDLSGTPMGVDMIRIRAGVPDDEAAVLRMGDEAVVWLAAQGRTGQWGVQPWTGDEKREKMIRERLAGGGGRIAETEDGEAVGVIVITEERQHYVPAVDERELYINLLLTSRGHRGKGIGALLVARARQEAASRGIDLIRVDCYAGDDGALMRWYTRTGFTPTERFTVGDWPGQVLQIRLSDTMVRI